MGRARARSLALVGWLALLPASVSAQDGIFGGLQKNLDLTFGSVVTTFTDPSGAVTKAKTNSFFPALTLNVDTLVYPSLRLNAGGTFEVNMFSTSLNGAETSSTISRNRPFFLLRSINPVLSPGIGYFRRVERASTQGSPGVKLVNDEYDAYLGWNPAGGPTSEFQFVRSTIFDGDRAFQDLARNIGSLVSNYRFKDLSAYYRGSYIDTDDRLHQVETRQGSQSARTSYGGSFLQKRLLLNATYTINHQDLTTRASGTGGEVDVPVTPIDGLSALSDTPVTAKLTSNPPLVDGNLTASAGINLGLPDPGTDTQARNIGLDFLNPTPVSRLLLWVDRAVPVAVASTFSWEIYSSPDNLLWRRETIVPAAPFGPFENRFEIIFPVVTARYLKVVVRPLSPVVPDSARFPIIFVTELQAFLRRPAADTEGRLAYTTHIVNSDVRLRLLNTPALYYEGFYLYNGPDNLGRSTDTLSNGLSVNHAFGRIFSAYARGAREQGMQPRGHRVATVTDASLTIDPIQTFRSSILYTGRDERIADVPSARRGLIVQNTAHVYAGVDVLFGFGATSTTRETGEVLHDRLFNVSGTIAPRPHLTLMFSYDDTATDRSGSFEGSPRLNARRGYASVAFDPVRTLHLVFTEDVLATTGDKTRATSSIDVNWAPFPDGTLQLVFAYRNDLRPLELGNERNIVGSIRWNVSRRSYIEVTYQNTLSEYVFQTIASKSLYCTSRLFF